MYTDDHQYTCYLYLTIVTCLVYNILLIHLRTSNKDKFTDVNLSVFNYIVELRNYVLNDNPNDNPYKLKMQLKQLFEHVLAENICKT